MREDALMMKPVATFATLLMALMPAAATPMPAVKSAQCPPGHMVSGGLLRALISHAAGSRSEGHALPKHIDAQGQQLLPRNATALILRGPRDTLRCPSAVAGVSWMTGRASTLRQLGGSA